MFPSADELLASTPICRRLSPEDRQRLSAVSTVNTYGRGDMIFEEARRQTSFYAVASERVKTTKATPVDEDVILSRGVRSR